MKFLSVCLVLVVGVYISFAATADRPGNNDFQRVGVLEQFLRAIYPDLADQGSGLATVKLPFSQGSFQIVSVDFEFQPCRWSGVTMEKKPVHYCGERARPGDKPFIHTIVEFGSEEQPPIFSFNAIGTFVSGELDAVREKFKEKSYSENDVDDKQRNWTAKDVLEALRSENPRYGPDHKAELLREVPLAPIQQFTRCKLRPESAQFEVRRQSDLILALPKLEWVLKGTEPETEKLKEAECTASFEPFEAHMTSFERR
jgi:hypothetical protein